VVTIKSPVLVAVTAGPAKEVPLDAPVEWFEASTIGTAGIPLTETSAHNMEPPAMFVVTSVMDEEQFPAIHISLSVGLVLSLTTLLNAVAHVPPTGTSEEMDGVPVQ
jgi:hypothetical protein